MNKVLVVATVASMIRNFCVNDIKVLQEKYEVHIATNFIFGSTNSKESIDEFKHDLESRNIICHQVDFTRSLSNIKKNIKAYTRIKRLIDKESYEFIHCHTPIAGAFTRFAIRKGNTPIIYTAHGFHFHKSGPLINWLIYYPIEKYLSKYTEILITINKEDYKLAKEKFKAKLVKYIPGVGIDIRRFCNINISKQDKLRELGIPLDSFIILSVGELNRNKNHEIIIKALAKINNKQIHYVLCGQGNLKEYLMNLIKELGLEKQVHLLGFRRDIPEICKISHLFAFPSHREGLGLAAIEAMACGLPLITSNVHGIVDYSKTGETGTTCSPKNINQFVRAILELYEDPEKRNKYGVSNMKLAEKYEVTNIEAIMKEIYDLLGEKYETTS